MWTLLTIIFVIISGTISEEEPCDYNTSVELNDPLFKDYVSLIKENETIVDVDTGARRGCVCLHGTCARKCCPPGQMYHLNKRYCVEAQEPFDPPIWAINATKEVKGFNTTKEFIFMYGKMVCSKANNEIRVPVLPASNEIFLQTDGKLYVHLPAHKPDILVYGPDKYCIDIFAADRGPPDLNALICFVPKQDKTSTYRMSSTCMLISCFFILLTVAVYAWVPELRNLHGIVLMAYLLSFFVGFLVLATMQILILKDSIIQSTCTAMTFVIYFSLLSAFFWLNVMCYDIWWTFSGKRAANSRGRSKIKRFIHYAMYAFGVPTALTILLAVLEFADLPIKHDLLPNLHSQGCFLYGNSKLLYLYGPIVILCVANMIFFSLTAFQIWKIKKETARALSNKDSSTNEQNKNDTQRFGLYVKLFAVMGINWIMEVVSSFYPDADFFWQFSDAYNVLVGLIIFIIFVCKKKTYKLIKKRYRIMMGKPMSRTQTTTSTSTRTLSHSRDEIQLNSVNK